MRLGVLFSGGKDSTLALHMAAEKEAGSLPNNAGFQEP